MKNEMIELAHWRFQLGESNEGLENARQVEVPHTWNIESDSEEYWGIGWYGCEIFADELWRGKRVFTHFGAVYHDAVIYLNGVEVGRHEQSGYTPFDIELTEELSYGCKNWLTVKVDNRFSDIMLPYERSFDWPNDGGIIRPVTLRVTGTSMIKTHRITARPFILDNGLRQDSGSGAFHIDAVIDGPPQSELQLEWEIYEGADDQKIFKDRGSAMITGLNIKTKVKVWPDVKFWHFDAPCLYTVRLALKHKDNVEDEKETVFGFKEFRTKGSQLLLNGEAVRLCGTEWMPGSNPEYGMAESRAQLETMLIRLKESNCVYTRFHWQQDDWVYDWCDRHGILVQEEVPFWGKNPEKIGMQQWKNFTQQINEMVNFHYNHPSIFAWGVGNELDGQNEVTIQYIKEAVAAAHGLDDTRMANYVTNTIYLDPSKDGTIAGDMLMINDYIGTWHGDLDQYAEWDKIVEMNPDKPITPAEFGLCEPAWPGGDKRREEIFLEKMDCYRKYPSIAGTIYFCLNDYRTQVGEDGRGKMKQRIHGSTDLYGQPKASYYVVKKEYAPVIIERKQSAIYLTCRNDLPSYEVRGYYIQLEKVGGELKRVDVPNLRPGESWSVDGIFQESDVLRIYRPNGDEVLCFS
jgi:beta-glucuronidase